jgi:NAD(P)H-dependent FMN reductase
VFYAVIEDGDLLLQSLADFDASILTTPEFNYGVPALIILIAAVAASRHKTEVQVATG